MKTLKILWVIINLLMIAYFSYAHVTVDKDAAIVFFYAMFLLTFPTGFTLPYIYFLVHGLIVGDSSIPKGNLYIYDIVLPGIGFMILGYIQWFILVPKIYHYFKSK